MDDLNQLKAEAAEIDAEFIPAGSPESETRPGMDYLMEARNLIEFAVTLFVPLFPSLANVYTDAAKVALANASAPMMEKYNMSMGGLFEKWGPEINFAMVSFPLGLQTYRAIQADLAERREKKPEPASKAQAVSQSEGAANVG